MDHNHSHSHENHSHHHHNVSGKNIGISILLNILITIGQIIGGLISGSMALLTDALHNFSDVVSLLLSYFTNRLAKKKSTEKQTYGFKRAEILSALVNSATLIAIAIYLIFESVERILNPKEVMSDLVIYFALASIVINFLSVLLLHKDAKESMNIKSAYLHLMTDVLTSVAVLIGGLLMKYYGIFWIDGVLSIIIAIYLIYSSYDLLWESLKILMQFTPKSVDIDIINQEICDLEEVENMHHFHLWQLNEKDFFFEAHIDLHKDLNISEFQLVLSKIETILLKHNINHSNIQPEFNRCRQKKLIVQH